MMAWIEMVTCRVPELHDSWCNQPVANQTNADCPEQRKLLYLGWNEFRKQQQDLA